MVILQDELDEEKIRRTELEKQVYELKSLVETLTNTTHKDSPSDTETTEELDTKTNIDTCKSKNM